MVLALKYRREVPPGFVLEEEETQYRDACGLDLEQMAWRRNKIAELKDPLLFKQEYPATTAEAFQASGHDFFIPAASVMKARKANLEPSGPLVIGYDSNWKGKDRASMAWRRGRKVLKIESRQGLDTMGQVGWVKQVIDTEKPTRVFIDVGGAGVAIYDRLVEMGYEETVLRAINFGSERLNHSRGMKAASRAAAIEIVAPRCGASRKNGSMTWAEPTFPTATACRPMRAPHLTSTTA